MEIKTTKEKVREERLKDPFWVMRDTQPDMDNQELFDLYVELDLFYDEQEKQLALEYIAEQVLLDLEEL